MKKQLTTKFSTLSIVLLCSAILSYGQTVTTGTDGIGAGTLRNQIATAAPNATITISPSVATILLIQGEITVNKTLTITGNMTTNTDITGSLARIFNVTSGTLTINNVSLSNGVATDGGAIKIDGANVVLNNVTLDNNTANGSSGSGGAILVGTGATLTTLDCTFSNNQANRAGGAIEAVAGTTLTLNNTNFTNNNAGVFPATAAPGNGGALHITGAGTANIMSGTATNNQAAAEGGAFWNGSGTMTIDSTTITNNSADGAAADNGGGGIYNLNNGTLNIDKATITNNTASGASGSGGGIFNDVDATLNITNSTITNNTASRAGGGIEGRAVGGNNTINLTNVMLNSNVAMTSPGNGGGLHMTGPGTIDIYGGTVNNNSAGAEGGGLWNGSGTMTIDSVTVSGNSASGIAADNGGGGIYNLNGGTLVIDQSTIMNNDADGTAGSGGGIFNDVGAQLTVTNSVIKMNTAKRAGGGIEDNSATSTIILTDVNLDSNSVAAAPGNGGGLHITGTGNATIMGGTVNGNTASREGGGLWNGAGTMTVTNTEVNDNTALGIAADDGGAGIFNNGGTLILNSVEVKNNMSMGTAASGGGLLSLDGDVTINNSTFETNAANRAGGAIELVDGNLTITSSMFNSNQVDTAAGMAAPGNGGAIHITGTVTATIDSSQFMANRAGREGGAIWNQNGSTMDIAYATIDGNVARGDGPTFGGGGIFNNGGTLTLSNSAVTNNTSNGTAGNGGGINVKSGAVSIYKSTISGNSSLAMGGGIFNANDLDITASTISDNTAVGDGGGIATSSTSAVELKSSIVAKNTGVSADLFSSGAAFMSNGYNLIGEAAPSAVNTGAGDMIGTAASPIDPMLNNLALNGMYTETQSLQSGSPAYDMGDPMDMTADQNGQMVFNTRRDIGASENQNWPTAVNDFDADINISIYPNPATAESITIESDQFENGQTVGQIVEAATGRTVKQFEINQRTNQVSISNMAAGMYLINIKNNSYKLMIK